MSRRAPWITLEGIEGTGKSTQLERLAARLAAAGRTPVVTREPGGTALGRELRRVLLACVEPPIHPRAELLLYAADRVQHLTQVVLPALAAGTVVLCDRHLDATLAYQGHGRGLGIPAVRDLHRAFPLDALPDRTILLDLDARVALERARGRDERAGRARTEGRFEAEPLAFHERVRAGYLELARAEPSRIRVVDAAGAAEDVGRRIDAALVDVLPELGDAP
jgi:dTMP kinase